MIKLDKLEKKDRGIVREVKIPKLTNDTLEKEYSEAVLSFNDIKAALLRMQVLEKELISKVNNYYIQLNKAQEESEKISINKGKLEKLIAEITNKNDPAILIYKQSIARLEVSNVVNETSLDKIRKNYQESKSGLEKITTELSAIKEKYVIAKKKVDDLFKQGEEFVDKDLQHANEEIEKLRIEHKYKRTKAIGQTDDSWLFLLIQPEEYKGDVLVNVEVKKDDKVKT